MYICNDSDVLFQSRRVIFPTTSASHEGKLYGIRQRNTCGYTSAVRRIYFEAWLEGNPVYSVIIVLLLKHIPT